MLSRVWCFWVNLCVLVARSAYLFLADSFGSKGVPVIGPGGRIFWIARARQPCRRAHEILKNKGCVWLEGRRIEEPRGLYTWAARVVYCIAPINLICSRKSNWINRCELYVVIINLVGWISEITKTPSVGFSKRPQADITAAEAPFCFLPSTRRHVFDDFHIFGKHKETIIGRKERHFGSKER
jgi:hypothetical protein